jgi:hypothetical protein
VRSWDQHREFKDRLRFRLRTCGVFWVTVQLNGPLVNIRWHYRLLACRWLARCIPGLWWWMDDRTETKSFQTSNESVNGIFDLQCARLDRETLVSCCAVVFLLCCVLKRYQLTSLSSIKGLFPPSKTTSDSNESPCETIMRAVN